MAFLVKRSTESPELRRMILDAKPGEVIEWNFPGGTVPMARGNGLGGLAGLGGEIGQWGQGLLGQDQLRIAQLSGLEQQRRFHEEQLMRQRIAQAARISIDRETFNLFRPPDPSLRIKREVEKHFPVRDDGAFQVAADKGVDRYVYVVCVWWMEPGKRPELVCAADVTFETVLTGRDWKTKLLEDLDSDLHRRKANDARQ